MLSLIVNCLVPVSRTCCRYLSLLFVIGTCYLIHLLSAVCYLLAIICYLLYVTADLFSLFFWSVSVVPA
jgi:hypothetical protein